MAVSRSTLFASLIDDPSEHPELFPTEEEQLRERNRLIEISERLAEVEATDDKELLEAGMQREQYVFLHWRMVDSGDHADKLVN
jgi:hypothetical protein